MASDAVHKTAATIRSIPRWLGKLEVFVLGHISGFALLAGVTFLLGPPTPPIESRALETFLQELALLIIGAVLLAYANGPPAEAEDG